MYSIYDQCAEVHNTPVPALNVGPVLREFTDLANNPNDPIGKHPEHYSLWELGEFDNSAGKLIPHDNKVHCANAIDLVQAPITPLGTPAQ